MKEPLVCRHGVALCYRCGVGPNLNEQKVARLAKMDEAVAQLSPNSPAPRPSRITGALPEKQSKPKKRRIIPCIHRGEYVGKLDCACDGARDTYRCTKLDRPGLPSEKAFCMDVLTSKPYSRIVDAKTKRVLHRVANGEVVLCKPLFTVDMNGSEHRLGCSKYEPIDNSIDSE
jgi:hypothetical protein